ncbi:MAG: tRNA epoxyqueuosine(34) reductase QueG [Bacillota bacterium]
MVKPINLKELAAAAGLGLAGITGAAPLDTITERLQHRLAEGRITPFEEKDPFRRISPGHLLPDCRTIIVLGLPYTTACDPLPLSESDGPRGEVARCARGLDYHVVLEQKGEQLARLIQKEIAAPLRYRVLSDRSPLIERELARLAGLGRSGENCTLITPECGSYVALGTILLDREMEENSPLPGSCAGCGRCLASCPTGALVAPHILDPTRCLSYLTQAPGVVPAEIRPLFGRRLYGCDRCQEVCPHNRRQQPPLSPENTFDFFPGQPLLLPLLQMTGKEFSQTIGFSAAGWRGKTTLQRNAVIALGNSGDQSAVPSLARLLAEDARPLIRLHAAWALGRIAGVKARRYLEISLKREQDQAVRIELRRALDEAI